MIELETIYRRSDNFVFRRIEGETILVPLRGNVEDLDCIYSLNELGARVWEKLDGSTELRAIRGAIAAEYAVAEEEVLADLSSFLSDLEEIAAVEIVNR